MRQEGVMTKYTNPVREALLQRKVSLGAWIQCGNAATAEIFARCGFDWVGVDCEHSDIDVALASDVFRGMQGSSVLPFARVRENDTLAIRQALDAGALGVIVPLVGSAEEAQRAVAAAKYPPLGIRGFGFARMNAWGMDFEEYVAAANDSVAVVVMIESKQGVENIESILAVDGVDGVFIGPYDLSGSYCLPGALGHDIVQQACKRVVEACESVGKSAGIHLVRPNAESIRKTLDDGFTFIALGIDGVFLTDGASNALKQAQEYLGKN
jgi:2-keto-3-deoxy-L-rhamnonate aldolase RhmA